MVGIGLAATNFVAGNRGITQQSVLDKYTRQLGKKAYEIDRLMRRENVDEFRSLLIERFPQHGAEMDNFFIHLAVLDTVC